MATLEVSLVATLNAENCCKNRISMTMILHDVKAILYVQRLMDRRINGLTISAGRQCKLICFQLMLE